MRVDLHSHTNASDGALSPQDLCRHAQRCGVDLLAITDHDSVEGYRIARDWLAQACPVQACQEQANQEQANQVIEGEVAESPIKRLSLLPAVEYSSVWSSIGVHVVGLGIDSEHAATLEACRFYSDARRKRADMIGERLAKLGMPGATEGALALAGSAQVGRPHFARYLVAQRHVRSEEEAFDRYLGAGKPGDIRLLWPDLAQVIAWIKAAGGVATLAHPMKYRLTATRLRKLAAEFAANGGGAMEVVVGKQSVQESQFLAQVATHNGLQASVGSDYHASTTYGAQLGEISELPKNCEPVWTRWTQSSAAVDAGRAHFDEMD